MDRQEPSSPLRILLVEDSLHDQLAFRRAIEKSGMAFELTVREQAEEIPTAMQAGSESFDIVVVDQNLPGIHGLASYKQLRSVSDLPPFIMLTGTGSEDLAVNALKAGMYDYIIKDPHRGYLQLLPLKLKDVRQRHMDRMARLKAKADLKKAYDGLEKIVMDRTAELARTVAALEKEIDERKKTERALRDSELALRILSLKIVETQENERRRLAREVHDSIGSSLAAIKLAVEGKLQSMQAGPPKGVISLEKIIEHIRSTMQEVRRISSALRPSLLDDLGLLATIEWFCQSSAELYTDTRIEINLDMQESEIPEMNKIVIYRVMQEALSNALKHSGADTVRVNLEKKHDCIRMCVKDNGSGFNPDDNRTISDPLSGYGLRGMNDRAEVVGGSLLVDTTPDRGTMVCLEIPWHSPHTSGISGHHVR
jgi:signal transduction histidine kinase